MEVWSWENHRSIFLGFPTSCDYLRLPVYQMGKNHTGWRYPSEKIWVRQLGWWHSQYLESHEIPWFQTTQQHRKNAVIFQMGRKNQQYLGNFQSQYWDPLESNDSNRDRQTIVFLVREGGPLGGIFHLQTNHNKVTGCWCKPTWRIWKFMKVKWDPGSSKKRGTSDKSLQQKTHMGLSTKM